MFQYNKFLAALIFFISISSQALSQSSVKIKATEKLYSKEKYNHYDNFITLDNGKMFIFGFKNIRIVSITPLNENFEPLEKKEIKILEKDEVFEYSNWSVYQNYLCIVFKEHIKQEKKVKYYLKIIDLNTNALVRGVKKIGTYSFETNSDAYYHTLKIENTNGKPYILNEFKGDDENPAPIYEIVFLDNNFDIDNKVSFKLKKNKQTDADYLKVKNIINHNEKYYFVVECAETAIKNKFQDFYTAIYVANQNGEIEKRIVLKKPKEKQLENIDVAIINETLYVSATYLTSTDKPMGGLLLALIDISNDEIIKVTETPIEKVFAVEKIYKRLNYHEINNVIKNINTWINSSKIYVIDNSIVVMFNSGWEYIYYIKDKSNYVRLSISEPILKYSMEGDLLKKTYLQKNSRGLNKNRSYASTFVTQLNDGSLLAIYGLKTDLLGSSIPIEEQKLHIGGKLNKKNLCVYSVINAELEISKPRELINSDTNKQVLFNPRNPKIIRSENNIKLINVNNKPKKRTLIIFNIK